MMWFKLLYARLLVYLARRALADQFRAVEHTDRELCQLRKGIEYCERELARAEVSLSQAKQNARFK